MIIIACVMVVLVLTFVAYSVFELHRLPRQVAQLSGDELSAYVVRTSFLIEDFRIEKYYWAIPRMLIALALAFFALAFAFIALAFAFADSAASLSFCSNCD